MHEYGINITRIDERGRGGGHEGWGDRGVLGNVRASGKFFAEYSFHAFLKSLWLFE